jgi:hypothetical protein
MGSQTKKVLAQLGVLHSGSIEVSGPDPPSMLFQKQETTGLKPYGLSIIYQKIPPFSMP